MEKCLSTNNKVKDYIFNELKHNNLKVGDRLPTEIQLATQLNISRSSVREALQSLKSIGLLSSSQGSGYTITGDITKIFSEALHVIMLTTPVNFSDISEIREALEVKAAELAIRNHISADSIAYLSQCVDDMEKASVSDASQVTKYDLNFHRKIAELSMNPFLINFIEALSQFSDNYILISWNEISQDQMKQLFVSHREIVQFLEKADTKEVTEAIINHYHIADNIIRSANSVDVTEKHSIEELLKKLYAEGLSNEQILNKLSSLQ